MLNKDNVKQGQGPTFVTASDVPCTKYFSSVEHSYKISFPMIAHYAQSEINCWAKFAERNSRLRISCVHKLSTTFLKNASFEVHSTRYVV
jgi:hypothetical protein